MDKPSICILSRTNLGLRPFEAALTDAGVPFHYIGRSGFFSQPEVRSLLAHIQAVLFPSDAAIAGCLSAPFLPTKFLPKSKLLARMKELKDDGTSYWKLLTQEPHSLVENKNLKALQEFVSFIHGLSRYRNMPAADVLKNVMQVLRVGDYFAEVEFSPDNDPLQNLQDLCKMASKYHSIKEFLDYCRRAAAASKSKKGVALATCHAAKGLEFHSVYLVGVADGILPHAKNTDIEAERNVFFVGASRAEHRLVISYAGPASPFLNPYLEKPNETSQPSN